ncbi:hypothetical protein [Lacibacter sp.]|uniref:hypothetical protein n=1 Tax=Lacibacter sp. TaxID=1915409 RepID=UPI002B4AEC04|nr:hypothetical protein [Lacibacter sp.]HLP37742.1 hypothetical protein [Lacibacter sp.]
MERSNGNIPNVPAYRKLRAYAFDPSLSLITETAQVNNITYKVEWEKLETNPDNLLRTVPVGEYIEIIDYDPASGCFYPPVDLEDKFVLAKDGLDPSVSDPQFHQQMVYAVLMTTIKNFEKSMGRKIQWADQDIPLATNASKFNGSKFVRRLRVYPHALRQANAYYNPLKKALLFGYFPAQPANLKLHLPGGTVFTCLSHDIIAHEVTHALLDGMHRRYIEPTHPDTRAFHEAFADIVALFQHFTFPDVLKHQIAKTRGDLAAQNLLGQLAQEFGKAMGHYGSLRDAIGHTDESTGEWVPHKPDPTEYATKMEFHARGSILVAAVFEAFLTIYKRRIRKLIRVATGGSGVLPDGDLHPDLVDMMSEIASETAQRMLKICVRSLDYCPPVDITFGDYLRAMITADVDMVADDEKNYRVAFIEAFQKRGIFPSDVKTMSVEALIYEQYPNLKLEDSNEKIFVNFLRDFKNALAYETDREEVRTITKEFITGSNVNRMGLHERINEKFIQSEAGGRFAELGGLLFPGNEAACKKNGFEYSKFSYTAKYRIDNLWLASRITPDDKIVNHVVLSITQRRGIRCSINDDGVFTLNGYFEPKGPMPADGFVFRGGCTLIFDLDTMQLKYAIKKDIDDKTRMEQQYRYQCGLLQNEDSTYFDENTLAGISGPFAFMHSFPHQH